jgi:hypothetical protein
MARIFLDANESRNGALAANDIVFGSTGSETVAVNTGATNVRIEGTVEVVSLAGRPSDFTYRAEGNNLVVFSGGVQVARIIVQDDANGTIINFSNGTTTANVGAGGLTLGGTSVSGTTGSVVPGDFDSNTALTEALADLTAAQAARTDFLEENETTAEDIAADLDDAQEAVDDFGTAAQVNAAVVTAQANVDAAEDEIAEVEGLSAAISDLRDAQEAADTTTESADAALAEQNAAVARYESFAGNDDIEVGADGQVDGLIVLEDGELVLAEDVTEQTDRGVTQLLAAVRNRVAADEAAATAQDDLIAAQDAVDELDFDAAAQAAVDEADADIAQFDDAEQDYRDALTAYSADETVAANQTALVAAYENLVNNNGVERTVDVEATNEEYAAAIALDTAEIDPAIQTQQDSLDDAREEAVAGTSNPLYDDLVFAEGQLEAAQQTVEDRNEAVADLNAAQAQADQLDALNDDVSDALAAIEDLGYEAPITVDGDVQATEDSDIFLGLDGTDDGSIENFGEEGDDVLYIGANYSLVELADDADLADEAAGSATEMEIFIQQVGEDTVIFIEDQAFNGSETDGTFDGTTITLTGVVAADVQFNSGYISIA